MFIKLGINPISKDNKSNPFNLFALKTSVTAYVNDVLFRRKFALFPKVAEIFNLCNVNFGPKLCAVDDLGYFDSYNVQELIEFLNNNTKSSSLVFDASLGVFPIEDSLQGHRQPSATKYHTAERLEINTRQHNVAQPSVNELRQNRVSEPFHPHSNLPLQYNPNPLRTNTHSHNQPHLHQHCTNSAGAELQPNVTPFEIDIPNAAGDASMSHFNLNMILLGPDVVNDSYFDDFVHPSKADAFDIQSFYGSSSESYVSPLDEEFFKSVSPDSANSTNEDRGKKVGLISEINKLTLVSSATSLSENVNHKKRKFDINLPIKQNSQFFNVDPVDYLMHVRNDATPYARSAPSKSTFNGNASAATAPITRVKKEPELKISALLKEQEVEDVVESKKLKLEEFRDGYKFQCLHCDATFKVKGYLTRHLKKHNASMAFTCPFYQEIPSTVCSTSKKNVFSGTKCHPTGGFSRRDTFKTHLKALHFIYPPGTKQVERNSIGGRCAGCFEYFENNHLWIVNHIEKDACDGSVNKHGTF